MKSIQIFLMISLIFCLLDGSYPAPSKKLTRKRNISKADISEPVSQGASVDMNEAQAQGKSSTFSFSNGKSKDKKKQEKGFLA